MEHENSGPRVHSIFRNQPSYTYFNKSIADPKDNVYLLLHEIESHFMEPEQLADKRAFENVTIVDPRNKKVVTNFLYDYTKNINTKAFYSPRPSSLNYSQHHIGMKVVKARQDGTALEEADFLVWHKMENKRLKETQEFQKFVYEYNQSNREIIYKPARLLMDLYKQWYVRKAERLLKKYDDEPYNTHLGLPHLRVCKESIKEQWADIVEVVIDTPKGNSNKTNLDLIQVKRNLENFFQNFSDSETSKEQLEDSAKSEFVNNIEKTEETPLYFIPLDSLLFLLTAGDYLDLPTEMLLDIIAKEGEDSEQKCIIMDLPLPPRQMGWHTWKQVVEQASMAYLSRTENYREETNVQQDNEVTTSCNDGIPYVLKTVEEYMESCRYQAEESCKFSQTYCKWQLQAKDKDLIHHIHTIVPINFAEQSIKLEYKPTFGCEIHTKYELLREWFKLKLLNYKSSTCHRLDINSFQTLLAESQTLEKLEFQLSTIYHIQMPQLLSNLYEFLSLLKQMPCGHYMLRYNPKFRDKFMLCKPSQEITQNTINLHQLLKTEPSELLFMAQQNYLPIADNLCSLMHVQHRLIPGIFRPMSTRHKNDQGKEMKRNPIKKSNEPINDRKMILQKLDAKKKDKLNALHRAHKKKNQRANRARRRALKLNNNSEEKNLQKEIELDQQVVGN
ncbi:interacts with the C terminus of ELL 2 isoform X2 [Musca autumnalis]